MKYTAVQPLQCVFSPYDNLDGRYQIEEYEILPCKRNGLENGIPWYDLLLIFPFDGIPENEKEGSEAATIFFKNRATMTRKAKKFVAWLVVVAGIPTRLSYESFGGITYVSVPIKHVPSRDFQEAETLATYKLDPNAKLGEYEELPRPDLSEKGVRAGTAFKFPSDMPRLTRKLFSLPSKWRKRYLDACSSFQFGLEIWGVYPTIALVAIVSAVESIMADEFNSMFCEDAKKICSLKRDITKKFRVFFERTLMKPLPDNLQTFLGKAYSERSSFVHRALLGEVGLCGPYEHYTKTSKLYSELRLLSRLVRAGLIQWLIEV